MRLVNIFLRRFCFHKEVLPNNPVGSCASLVGCGSWMWTSQYYQNVRNFLYWTTSAYLLQSKILELDLLLKPQAIFFPCRHHLPRQQNRYWRENVASRGNSHVWKTVFIQSRHWTSWLSRFSLQQNFSPRFCTVDSNIFFSFSGYEISEQYRPSEESNPRGGDRDRGGRGRGGFRARGGGGRGGGNRGNYGGGNYGSGGNYAGGFARGGGGQNQVRMTFTTTTASHGPAHCDILVQNTKTAPFYYIIVTMQWTIYIFYLNVF